MLLIIFAIDVSAMTAVPEWHPLVAQVLKLDALSFAWPLGAPSGELDRLKVNPSIKHRIAMNVIVFFII